MTLVVLIQMLVAVAAQEAAAPGSLRRALEARGAVSPEPVDRAVDRIGALRSILSIDEPELREAAIDECAAWQPTLAEVTDAVQAGPFFGAGGVRGLVEWRPVGPDGVARHAELWIPQELTPETAVPLLVTLHGGVDAARTNGGMGMARVWAAAAEDAGFLVLAPSGGPGATWWDENGLASIEARIDEVKRVFRVDPNRIAVHGFSDGGSACFVLGNRRMGQFSAFLPCIGSPLVADRHAGPLFARNLAATPYYVINTGRDHLYPAERLRASIDLLRSHGVRLIWKVHEDGGHDFSYAASERPLMVAFFRSYSRDAMPEQIDWEGTRVADGDLGWLAVRGIAERRRAVANSVAGSSALRSLGHSLASVDLGGEVTAEAGGVRIVSLEGRGFLLGLGFKVGDVLRQIGDGRLRDQASLRAAVDAIEDGAGFRVVFEREGQERTFTGRHRPDGARPEGTSFSARVVARLREGRLQLETRNVRDVIVRYDQDLASLGTLEVVANGRRPRRMELPALDPLYLLRDAARRLDSSRMFVGQIRIRP